MGRTFGRGTRYDARFRKDERVIRLYESSKETKNGTFHYLRGAFAVNGQVISIRVSKATSEACEKAGARGKDRFGGHFTHWARVKASPRRARRYAPRRTSGHAGGYGASRAPKSYPRTSRSKSRAPSSGYRRKTYTRSRRRY